jgi:hypothetical protein
MSRCFFGILGAKSPYAFGVRREDGHSGGRSLLHDSAANDDFFFASPTSSVAPIAGGIVGCFLFLVSGVRI